MLHKSFEACVELVGDRRGKDGAYSLDSSKLRGSLGWKDRISLESGLEQTIDWVKTNLQSLQQQPANYIHKT